MGNSEKIGYVIQLIQMYGDIQMYGGVQMFGGIQQMYILKAIGLDC